MARYEGPLIVLDAIFDQEIDHQLLGTIARGTLSIEYYWLDRWFNVFRFEEPEGGPRRYYCNINQPPSFEGQVLSYVDLDIDVVVSPDFSFKVLDTDEFELNAARYAYPITLKDNVRGALNQLIDLIESRAFPFNE